MTKLILLGHDTHFWYMKNNPDNIYTDGKKRWWVRGKEYSESALLIQLIKRKNNVNLLHM
jgi:hypothetical protein